MNNKKHGNDILNEKAYDDDTLLKEIKNSASDYPIPAALSPDAMRQELRFRQKSRRLRYLKRVCAAAASIVLVLGGGFAVYQTLGGFISSKESNFDGSGHNSNSSNAELALGTESQGSDSYNQTTVEEELPNSSGSGSETSESGSNQNDDSTNADKTSTTTTAKNATVGDKYHLASGYEEVYAVLASTVSSSYLADGAEAWIAVEDSDDAVSGSSVFSSDSSLENSYSSTNTMVESVDEGDIVKINEEYIYVITEEDHSTDYVEGDYDLWYETDTSNHITIFHIEDGITELVGTLDCCPSATSSIQEIYLDGERLYVIYSEYYMASAEQSSSNADSDSNTDTSTDSNSDTDTDSNSDTDTDSDSGTGTDTSDGIVSYSTCDTIYYVSDYGYRTGLITYDVSDAANPKQLGHITQDGDYYTSRKNGDYIYLFSKNYPNPSYCDGTDTSWTEESLLPEVNGSAVSYDSIYLPTSESDSSDSPDSDTDGSVADSSDSSNSNTDGSDDSFDSDYAFADGLYLGYSELIISSIYICGDSVEDVTDSLVIVNDDSVYMSENAIYLYSTDYIYGDDDDDNSSDDTSGGNSNDTQENNGDEETDSFTIGGQVTIIAKFTYEDGILNAVNSATVTGSVLDKFALHESDGVFQILTTSYSYEYTYGSNGVLENIETTPSNHLYLFDADMQQLGSLDGIAEGEEIYAARYVGDIVYFITYLNTDPLFAVDISDPANPTLLGQLEITGFSDYLHPYGDGLLLGIGYETDPDTGEYLGVKLTMFDVSDPTNLTVLDTVVLEEAEYTPATYYYKTVLADTGENIIGYAYTNWNEASTRYDTYYCVYEWTDEGFKQVLKTELATNSSCTVRGLYSGDYLYVVNTSGSYDDIVIVSSYDMDDEYREVDSLTVQ